MKQPIKRLTKEQKRWIKVTSSMTFREMSFLIQRYHMNMNLEEISKQAGLTVERTRQIESIALTKITQHSKI